MKAQNIFSIIIFLISIFNIQSICFASQKHNGMCKFYAKKESDTNYYFAGECFMTAKIEGAKYRDLDLKKRFCIGTNHQEYDTEHLSEIVNKKNGHINDAKLDQFLVDCGGFRFEVERKPLESKKPVFKGSNDTDGECKIGNKKNPIPRSNLLVWEGCDLAVFEPKNYTSELSKKLDEKIRGFDPLAQLSTDDEYAGENAYLGIDSTNPLKGDESLKCKISDRAKPSALQIVCSFPQYGSVDELIEGLGLNSGRIVLFESKEKGGNILESFNNIPMALGIVTAIHKMDSEFLVFVDKTYISAGYQSPQITKKPESNIVAAK